MRVFLWEEDFSLWSSIEAGGGGAIVAIKRWFDLLRPWIPISALG